MRSRSVLVVAFLSLMAAGLNAQQAGPLVTWNQQTELTAPDGPNLVSGLLFPDQFGRSVSVDGTTAVVGANSIGVNSNSEQGAAYVFVQSGGTWIEQARLTASDGAPDDNFGDSVSVNGATVVVGAPGKGAAYVFVQSGGNWTQQAKLTESDAAAYDDFGSSVAVRGAMAVIGAEAQNSYLGAAYVFTQSGTTWSQQAKLTPSDGTGDDWFGWSVSASGSTILVGAWGKKVNSNGSQGAAYVFAENGGAWTEQSQLTASDGAAGDSFGYSVSLSGAISVIGAYNKTVNSNSGQGAAYVFVQSGGTWSQQAELIASDGAANNLFGVSMAVSGTTALVGSKALDGYPGPGAAYVFTESSSTTTLPLIASVATTAGGQTAVADNTYVSFSRLPCSWLASQAEPLGPG